VGCVYRVEENRGRPRATQGRSDFLSHQPRLPEPRDNDLPFTSKDQFSRSNKAVVKSLGCTLNCFSFGKQSGPSHLYTFVGFEWIIWDH
jgi:hypothetical protein